MDSMKKPQSYMFVLLSVVCSFPVVSMYFSFPVNSAASFGVFLLHALICICGVPFSIVLSRFLAIFVCIQFRLARKENVSEDLMAARKYEGGV